MRIVFITNNYTPYSGGVVSSINASVAALRKAGHEVFIITLDFLGGAHDDPEYVFRIPCPFRCMYKENHLAVPWRPYHYMLGIVKELKPDIVHTHHPFYLGSTALKIAQHLALPIVLTYHTSYEDHTHYIPLPGKLSRYMARQKVMAYWRVLDGIIAPSNYIQQQIQSRGVQTPTVVIPSGLQELFLASAPPIKKYAAAQRVAARPFRLLYVGRFTQEKNIPYILDVMQMMQAHGNFQLTLVGYGIEYNNLRAYAYQKLNLSQDAVQFVHKPPKQELLRYYQQADLFLFSSFLDTQGLVLAEAMACGTPVIAVHGPGQQDIIRDGYNGFLVDDKDDMVRKIVMIMHDQQLHEQLQVGAVETSREYHPAVVAKRLIDFYAGVLKSRTI